MHKIPTGRHFRYELIQFTQTVKKDAQTHPTTKSAKTLVEVTSITLIVSYSDVFHLRNSISYAYFTCCSRDFRDSCARQVA